ncbi:MAG: hypothetical protein F4106_01035 [Gemmatimonadetes bacterium]|nr:hypothetical protein [Gemmatimonadota bacterium]MXX72629.1 hypothetical protein [Gemmatimonadota bacterium]MYC92868.1 hypothetical protein [Gemmatimonadota bacterium]MYG34276.1 hypothetical protein [Gemmatimonadota bacterium]MYJ16637.1 hypothetical protein [Gemmatimonadota bacterium]
MSIQRVAGVSALMAVACNILGVSVLIGSAASAGIDVSLIAGEPTAEVHRAVNAIQPGPYAAVWLGVASWLFTLALPLGLHAALKPAGAPLMLGVTMFYASAVALVPHFGLDAVGWTAMPERGAAASGTAQESFVGVQLVMRDASILFERIAGLARGASMFCFALVFAGVFGWRRLITWMAAIGALELLFRIPMIVFDWALVAWVDAFYVVWMIAMGVWLAFSADARSDDSDGRPVPPTAGTRPSG